LYSVNASSVAQIQIALNFARNANLRFVVKNTGHDFADKSLGKGALSVWLHGMNDIDFLEAYSYGEYDGPAVKLGTGAMTADVYALAEREGVTAVGGECRASSCHVTEMREMHVADWYRSPDGCSRRRIHRRRWTLAHFEPGGNGCRPGKSA
jgi:hypothetical protein